MSEVKLEVAERFPLRDYLFEEMSARKWSQWDLAVLMGGDHEVNYLTLNFIFYLPYDKSLLLGQDTADRLGFAFGINPQTFMNIAKTWRDSLPDSGPEGTE